MYFFTIFYTIVSSNHIFRCSVSHKYFLSTCLFAIVTPICQRFANSKLKLCTTKPHSILSTSRLSTVRLHHCQAHKKRHPDRTPPLTEIAFRVNIHFFKPCIPLISYPLIAPPVTPAIIFSDRKMYKTNVGENTIKSAVNICQ